MLRKVTGEGHSHQEDKRELLGKKCKDTESKWAPQEWCGCRLGQGCAVGWQPLKYF